MPDAKPLLSEQVQAVDQIHDLFLLALVHQHEGNTPRARDFYERGCAELSDYQASKSLLELGEACRLRAEVEEVLWSD